MNHLTLGFYPATSTLQTQGYIYIYMLYRDIQRRYWESEDTVDVISNFGISVEISIKISMGIHRIFLEIRNTQHKFMNFPIDSPDVGSHARPSHPPKLPDGCELSGVTLPGLDRCFIAGDHMGYMTLNSCGQGKK